MPLAKREQLKGTQHVALASKISPSSTSGSVSKIPSHDHSLGIGVGAGALYMLMSCHEEMKRLNKTAEQTENLVKELKQQLQQHHEYSSSSTCSGNYSVHSAEIRSASSQDLHASMDQMGQLPVATGTYNMDLVLKEQVSATRGMAKDQMAVLAAELEAELELMELNINAEEILFDQSLMHDAGEVSSKGLQNSYYSDTSSHGMLETSNIGRPSAHPEASQLDYGVSPIELDHRLREVLEAQQQERILELEQLLKETEAKLLEREHEILRWRNHANSLTNLFQPASAYGTHVLRLNNTSGAESVTLYDNFVAAVPQVSNSTEELLHSFHDPPISTQVNYVESASGSDLLGSISKQETNLCSSSTHVLSNDSYPLNRASYPSSPPCDGSPDTVRVVTEYNCCWDEQGTGIDTPEFVIMEELDVHTAASESLRGQAVSKSLEISDCMLPNGWSNEMLKDTSSLQGVLSAPVTVSSPLSETLDGFNEHLDSLLMDVDTPPSGNKLEPSSLHHGKCKSDSLSPSDFCRAKEELERDSSDVKRVVNSFMSKPAFSDLDSGSSGQEAMQAPKRSLKLKSKSLQIATRRSRKSSAFDERSMEEVSPVLDKIRHYEALGGHVHGKHS